MRQHRLFLLALGALVVVPCWGCGSGGGATLSLVPVKGKVTYKGQPLTTGVVRFEPESAGRPANGKIQSDGTYSLSTMKDGDGVVAGPHIVTIAGFEKRLANDRNLRKYLTGTSSGLTAEVDAEHTEFNFDLK